MLQATESLRADEFFTKCARGFCESPAKLIMNKQRAQCTRCRYDFCTNCRRQFHGGSVCEVFKVKNSAKKPHGVSSGKSKNSLRRISRLESFPWQTNRNAWTEWWHHVRPCLDFHCCKATFPRSFLFNMFIPNHAVALSIE